MLVRSDLKYARLRRESITLYCPGSGPELPARQAVDPGPGGRRSSIRSGRRLLSTSSSCPSETTVPSSPLSDCPLPADDPQPLPPRLRFNISGTVVETYASTMARFPDSLLGDPQKRLHLWNEEHKEFYLDRHVPSFEAVFQFYQTGLLHRPMTVPLFTFVEELKYYELGAHVVNGYMEKEGFLIEKDPIVPSNISEHIWVFMEYPKSSVLARIYAIISIAIICVSAASFCAETMPQFAHYHCRNASRTDPVSREVSWHEVPNLTNVFFLLEAACVLWFTLEFILRFLCCPNKGVFLCSKLNLVDLITVIPYSLVLAMILLTQSCYIAKRSASILIFRMLRIFRIFKLTKHFRALQIFVLCLRASVRELRLFLFLVAIGCIILAVAIYVVEYDHPDTMILTIPDGIWWAVATMTTVGYGDVYPVSVFGKLVGVICFITGCLVVALPTPPIVSNFNHFYRVETGRGCNEVEA